jgi:two-component system alkaline phosphatase synthesis response regulator PhoP
MIVEDDLDMIELLSLVLRRGGYTPISAVGGVQALEKLQEEGADLILLDLMMEGMNGWEVLRNLKNDEDLASIPVVIVSARHRLEDPDGTQEFAGLFEGYLVKPFLVNDLLAQIGECVE